MQNLNTQPSAATDYGFSRKTDFSAYKGLAFDEWSLDCDIAERRRHTLLIYMNGSDLESETAAGTDDLRELMRSGVDETAVNVVIFTGGANRWHTKAVPSNECGVSVLRGGKITQIGTVGQRDMGNAGTLASFIEFGMQHFPAAETSLILWDHGGGSIAGYGADENFDMSTLTLTELEYAFEKAGLREKRLALLGFDACLMATVEMAVVAADFAGLLLASENVEPGDGWDYRTVAELPGATAEQFGVAVCEAFAEIYRNSREEFTLSLVRTREAESVMGALGKLAEAAVESSAPQDITQLQEIRRETKTFGNGTPDEQPCDMIDILDFTRALEGFLSKETAQLRYALNNAVRFNVYNSDAELGGLSVYHPFLRGETTERSLEVYRGLNMSGEYTAYLTSFAASLEGTEIPAEPPQYTNLLGHSALMYEVSSTENGTTYAVSATVNGKAAQLLIYRPHSYSGQQQRDELLGYRKRDGFLIQKGYDLITTEDEVVLQDAKTQESAA